jgi:uncharacterized membrane protein
MSKYLDAASFVLLIVLLVFTGFALYGPDRLPDHIPTHFDQLGHADSWTTPSSFEVWPVVAVIVYLVLSVVAAFSWLAKNAAQKNTDGVPGLEVLILKLIAWIKAELIAGFAYIQISSIQAVRHQEVASSWLGWWILLAALLLAIVWYVAQMFRARADKDLSLGTPD